MPLLGRPSRSYKNVEHNAEGLSAVGSAPYSSVRRKDNGTTEYTVKTFRPSYAELHFKRQAMHDPHPNSSFSPLPPAFQLGRKNKEQALAGQRAELDHILEPGYKTAASVYGDDDNTSVAGPSRLSSVRTAGGLSALGRRKQDESLRHSGSVTNFTHHSKSSDGGVVRRGGVYVDSTGRLHDTEYDPFAGVSELSRRKSRRRSAFGGQNRRGSCSSESVSGSSDDSEVAAGQRTSFDARSSTEEEREKDEIRRRLQVERRRLDEVSGYAAARRKSMMSDRASGIMSNGRTTPSIRSGNDDSQSIVTNGTGQTHTHTRTASRLSQHHVPSPLTPTFEDATTSTSPTSNGRPRTASFASASSYNTGRISGRATSSAGGGDESPRKHTETTPPNADYMHSPVRKQERPREAELSPAAVEKPPPAYKRDMSVDPAPSDVGSVLSQPMSPQTKPHRLVSSDILVPVPKASIHKPLPPEKDRHETITTIRSGRTLTQATPRPTLSPIRQTVERAPDGATRITGFDAPVGPPRTPMPASIANGRGGLTAMVPESVRSHSSSRSSERDHRSAGGDHHYREVQVRQKPAERPREQVFPETPAQAKRREEKERRNLRAGRTPAGARPADMSMTVTASARTRILPEIEIVEDDDPRIIFPSNGQTTRVQHYPYDHVRTVGGQGGRLASIDYGSRDRSAERDRSFDNGSVTISVRGDRDRDTSIGSNRAPSAIIEETGGGYLPSRWASGDRQLRVTEEQKERYRPSEWGGRHGDLGGRTEEWRPDAKDALKRNLKDLSTNARFSMFRAKKKILRKTDI